MNGFLIKPYNIADGFAGFGGLDGLIDGFKGIDMANQFIQF